MNFNIDAMLSAADQAAEFLKTLGNRHRLLILCQLLEGERSVGEFSSFLGIRDSTVSQHLALLRREGLVRTRREGQTIWYSLSSEPARDILAALYRNFCPIRADATQTAPGRHGRYETGE